MTSYQKRKKELKELESKLQQTREFERMFKNYIRAIHKGQTQTVSDCEKWFAKNSPQYAKEIGLDLN